MGMQVETEGLLEKRNVCPLCGSDIPLTGARFWVPQLAYKVRVIECPKCGLVYKEMRPTQKCLNLIYDHTYVHHKATNRRPDSSACEYVSRMRLARGERYLDYGCGNGSVVLTARGMGIDGYGADPFLPADIRSQDRRYLFKVRADSPEIRQLGDFDAVSMWAVLEHLDAPLEAFIGLSSVLKNGGHLYLNAPNADSMIARKYGEKWAVALLLEHSTFWTIKALSYVAEVAGFKIITVKKCGVPYPLNKRESNLESFGLGKNSIVADGCANLSSSKPISLGPRYTVGLKSSILHAGRRLVNYRCLGACIRGLLNLTGIGDHYYVVMRKDESVKTGGHGL